MNQHERVDQILSKATGKKGLELEILKVELAGQGVVLKGQSLGFSHPHLADYFTIESLIEQYLEPKIDGEWADPEYRRDWSDWQKRV